MNTPPDPLTERLQSWRVAPPARPEFRSQVWRRIERDRIGASWPAYLRAHATAWAFAALVVLGAAAYSGNAMARAQVSADRDTMVTNYLIDLDPRVQAVLKPAKS